jgi:hypothetical protein
LLQRKRGEIFGCFTQWKQPMLDFPWKADVEISFDLPNLDEAESIDPSWVDPQLLCITLKQAESRLDYKIMRCIDLSPLAFLCFWVFSNCFP